MAYPSKARNEAIIKAEDDRVEAQRKKLGEEGLKAAGETVEKAIESQKLPPNSVLEAVPMGDASKIKFR